jgi:hypothetical protein
MAEVPVLVFQVTALFHWHSVRPLHGYNALQYFMMLLSISGRMVNPLNTVFCGPNDTTDVIGAKSFEHTKPKTKCITPAVGTVSLSSVCVTGRTIQSLSLMNSGVPSLATGGTCFSPCLCNALSSTNNCSWPQGLRPITVQFSVRIHRVSMTQFPTGTSCPRVRARASALLSYAWTSASPTHTTPSSGATLCLITHLQYYCDLFTKLSHQ